MKADININIDFIYAKKGAFQSECTKQGLWSVCLDLTDCQPNTLEAESF